MVHAKFYRVHAQLNPRMPVCTTEFSRYYYSLSCQSGTYATQYNAARSGVAVVYLENELILAFSANLCVTDGGRGVEKIEKASRSHRN